MADQGTAEQLIINGQEYSPEDATQLIELGNKWKETESRLNTSLDKVYPEYTRATQRNKELETELQESRKAREELEAKYKTPTPPANPDRDAIIKNAREVGIADREWIKEEGYMTKAEVEEFLGQKQSQQALVDNILKNADKLEKEIDGTDGRVPFNQKAVLAYASAYNIDKLEDAYDEMNERANAKWKEAQIAKEERPGLTTLKGKGVKAPEPTKITDDNFKAAWEELYGTGE